MSLILPEGHHLGEAAMRHHWLTTRRLVPHSDGQRRWDRAYQLLLEWAATGAASGRHPVGGPSPSTPVAEAPNEHRDLCESLDPTAGRGADDRRADRAAPGTRPGPGLGAPRGERLP